MGCRFFGFPVNLYIRVLTGFLCMSAWIPFSKSWVCVLLLLFVASMGGLERADASLLSFRGLGLSSFFGRVATCPEGSMSSIGTSDSADCECLSGRYKLDGVCVLCPADTYKANVGDLACTVCPDHSSSLPGAVSVASCLCGIGYGLQGAVGAADMCQECAAGGYKDFISNAACLACPLHSSSINVGSTSAGDCVCVPGYAGGVLDNGCVACGVGTYKDTQHAECQACPDFTTTDASGSNSVTDCLCLQGYTAQTTGVACVECAGGEYKDFTGSTACLVCPLNSNSPPGSTSPSSCVCSAGFTTDGTSCVQCGAGSYKTGEGGEPCTPCPTHASSPLGATSLDACYCVAGYHGPATACTACVNDFYCPGDGGTYACPGNSSSPTLSVAEEDCTCDMGYSKEED